MTRLGRYMLVKLLLGVVFVTAVLTLVACLTQSMRYVDYIVNRGLSLGGFFTLVLLLMPSYLTVILPVAMFATLVFVYARLLADSELVVMRALGLSQWQLALPGLFVAGLTAAGGLVLLIWLMPAGYRDFKDRQDEMRREYASVLLQEGSFNTLIDGVTVYVRERDAEGNLRGILLHDNRNPRQAETWMAESGRLARTDGGLRGVLLNGNRQTITYPERKTSLLFFDRYVMDLAMLTEDKPRRFREASERYLSELFEPGDGYDDRRNADRFLAEAHRRLSWPLFVIAVACVALAALLAGEFSRRGQSRRLATAAGLAVGVQLLAVALPNLAAKLPAVTPLIYASMLAVIVASLWVLLRRPGRRLLPAVPGARPA